MSTTKKREGQAEEKAASAMQRSWQGVWIPKKIWWNLELSWLEKVTLLEIHSFEMNEQACFKSNADFAALLGDKSISAASRTIQKLIKDGWLKSKITYKKGTKQVDKRYLATSKKFLDLYRPDEIDLDAVADHHSTHQDEHSNINQQVTESDPPLKNEGTPPSKMKGPSPQKRLDNIPIEYTNLNNSKRDIYTPPAEAKKPKPKPKTKPKSKDAPKPDGVDDQVWDDWLDQRKQLKASTSQTVIARLQNQANAAGISLNEVFCIMLERGWKGFQADWIEKDKATPLPDDFQFTAERQIACQKLAPELGDEIHASFNRFITYAQREGKRYQDWDAALESWILGDLKRFKEQQQGMKTFKDRDRETARMSLVKNLTDTSWAEGLDLDDADSSMKALRAI